MVELNQRSRFFVILVLSCCAGSGLTAQEAARKKTNIPPPEQSSTVGVLGAHRSDASPVERGSTTPPPVAAAPEIPKVEAEAPSFVEPGPRGFVQGDQTGSSAMRMAAPKPTGYLVDHPVISGLVAGLIGSDLGSKLYGGTMMGDRDAAQIGYGLRILMILSLALVLFRLIGQLANRGSDLPRAARGSGRREPSFGKNDSDVSGRREPRFDRGPER